VAAKKKRENERCSLPMSKQRCLRRRRFMVTKGPIGVECLAVEALLYLYVRHGGESVVLVV